MITCHEIWFTFFDWFAVPYFRINPVRLINGDSYIRSSSRVDILSFGEAVSGNDRIRDEGRILGRAIFTKKFSIRHGGRTDSISVLVRDRVPLKDT